MARPECITPIVRIHGFLLYVSVLYYIEVSTGTIWVVYTVVDIDVYLNFHLWSKTKKSKKAERKYYLTPVKYRHSSFQDESPKLSTKSTRKQTGTTI